MAVHVVTNTSLDAVFSDIYPGCDGNCYLIAKQVDGAADTINMLLPLWQSGELDDSIVPMLVTVTPLYPAKDEQGNIITQALWQTQQQQALVLMAHDEDKQTELLNKLNDDDNRANTIPFATVTYLQEGVSSLIMKEQDINDNDASASDATDF